MRTVLKLAPTIVVLTLVARANDPCAAGLELQLEPEEVTVHTGEELPVTMTLINTGDTTVRLAKPGDGSSLGSRTPVVGWSVIDARLKKKQHPLYPQLPKDARCGNINALTKDDLLELRPGQEIELRDWVYVPVLKHPGAYRVSFHYRNVPDFQWSGIPLGQHDPEAMEWIKNSTEVSLWSNEIIVTVRELK